MVQVRLPVPALMFDAATPPKVTDVVDSRLEPLIVTVTPPSVVPGLGVTEVIVGVLGRILNDVEVAVGSPLMPPVPVAISV